MKKRLVDLKVGDIVSLRINNNSKIKKYIYLGIDKEDIFSFDTLNLYMQLLKEGRMYFILLPYQYANNEEWTHNYIKYAPMQNLNHKYKVETDEELAKKITLAVVKRKLLIENLELIKELMIIILNMLFLWMNLIFLKMVLFIRMLLIGY